MSIPAGVSQYQKDAEELKTNGFFPGAENIPGKFPEEKSADQPVVDGFPATDAGSEDEGSGNKVETQADDYTLISDEGRIKDHRGETMPVPGDKEF